MKNELNTIAKILESIQTLNDAESRNFNVLEPITPERIQVVETIGSRIIELASVLDKSLQVFSKLPKGIEFHTVNEFLVDNGFPKYETAQRLLEDMKMVKSTREDVEPIITDYMIFLYNIKSIKDNTAKDITEYFNSFVKANSSIVPIFEMLVLETILYTKVVHSTMLDRRDTKTNIFK